MKITRIFAAILPLKKRRKPMSRIECPEGHACTVTATAATQHEPEMEFIGSFRCSHSGFNFPYKFVMGGKRNGEIGILAPPHTVDALSAKLPFDKPNTTEKMTVKDVLSGPEGNDLTRDDLIQDIEQACAAKQWELYKASVVMCRRMIGIALCDCLLANEGTKGAMEAAGYKPKRLERLPLGPLLEIEEKLSQPLLTNLQRALATRINSSGDQAAHNKVVFEPDEVDSCILDAAKITATLIHSWKSLKLAKQSEPKLDRSQLKSTKEAYQFARSNYEYGQ